MSGSVFGGALTRRGRNDWRWSDGEREPRVTDLSASCVYNFRCRTIGGETLVEVMLSAAHRERDVLGWVLDGVAAGRYDQSDSGDHRGPLTIDEDGNVTRMRIEPGEDPLLGNEAIVHKRAIPRVALVPIAEWDKWAAENPYGATWATEHEAEIFARARALGWNG